MKTTLLIMAAGLGSRFGGDKQTAHLGPNGEMLIQYAMYDACRAGFDKVVFVIRRSMAEAFARELEGAIPAGMEVHYAFQEYDSLPGGFIPPEGRTKPYGTVHAVLAAKDVIHEPFAVINADDYYGVDAFRTMAESLREMQHQEKAASMVAYQLSNTLSENGSVTRGVCEADGQGHLAGITETYGIRRCADGVRSEEGEGALLPPLAPVSMNFWGLTPWYFQAADEVLEAFLRSDEGDPMKKECVLPMLIDQLMREQGLQVRMLSTPAIWFGVTYQADRELVAQELRKLHLLGVYPEKLPG